MKQKFFFYGTLSHKVESNLTKKLHEKLELLGKGFVIGRLFAIPWGDTYYPALILDESGYHVYGNLYEVKDDFSNKDLKELDDYEEFYTNNLTDSEYIRKEVMINFGPEKLAANVYVYHRTVPNEAVEITSGDF